MEVQRELFRVSTARDTADATNRFRNVLGSSVWYFPSPRLFYIDFPAYMFLMIVAYLPCNMYLYRRTNRNFGRTSFLLELFGLVLIGWRDMVWPRFTSLSDHTNLDTQIISINASNLLIFTMRTALLLSLLYFVQVGAICATSLFISLHKLMCHMCFPGLGAVSCHQEEGII